VRFSVVVAAALALSFGGGTGWRTYAHDRIAFRYPPSWDATSAQLTPVTSPGQVLAVASYPLPRNDRGADGCEPKEALDRLPATGAFVFGWETFAPGELARFPPRPRRLALGRLARSDCMGRGYRIAFRDHGRFFEIHVALGRRAPAATRRTVLRILDSLRVRG
jgi:hypothetical protein